LASPHFAFTVCNPSKEGIMNRHANLAPRIASPNGIDALRGKAIPRAPKRRLCAFAAAFGLFPVLVAAPVQFAVQGAAPVAALAAGVTLLSVRPAFAQILIPGVGIVVKKKPGNAPIARGTSDGEGNIIFKGLEPGEYSICFAADRGDGGSCADVTVGKDGTIRAQTVFDEKRKAKRHNYVGHVTLLR
jgi:hypothetical protein